ncbi:MAG: hypothetical protein WBQ17_17515 [Rhizomicrobium sp.]
MAKDWFRKTKWDAENEADFFARLAKAKPLNRAQYLGIQAITLIELKPEIGARLADLALNDYPRDVQRARWLSCRAKCAIQLKNIDEALNFFELAIQEGRNSPNMDVGAPADFAFLVAENDLHERYDDALRVLEEFPNQNAFPLAKFRFDASRALILSALGRGDEARNAARNALEAAAQGQTALRYHRAIGLVGNTFSQIRRRLKKIADDASWIGPATRIH